MMVMVVMIIGVRGGLGGGVGPPGIFQIVVFGPKKKNHVIFEQNHFIWGGGGTQAMEKIFGQH